MAKPISMFDCGFTSARHIGAPDGDSILGAWWTVTLRCGCTVHCLQGRLDTYLQRIAGYLECTHE